LYGQPKNASVLSLFPNPGLKSILFAVPPLFVLILMDVFALPAAARRVLFSGLLPAFLFPLFCLVGSDFLSAIRSFWPPLLPLSDGHDLHPTVPTPYCRVRSFLISLALVGPKAYWCASANRTQPLCSFVSQMVFFFFFFFFFFPAQTADPFCSIFFKHSCRFPFFFQRGRLKIPLSCSGLARGPISDVSVSFPSYCPPIFASGRLGDARGFL